MSSVDPMLLLAGKQPRRKMVRIKREEPVEDDEPAAAEADEEPSIGETGLDEDEEGSEQPQQEELPLPESRSEDATATQAKPVKPSPYSKPVKTSQVPLSMSLTDRCRTVIVAHLERYPPAVLGLLDTDEWSTLIQRRHAKTKPARGTGGLDGTGRLTPAVTERFITAVEDENEHLINEQTDVLVWKDVVNMRFKKGGLNRPRMLEEPWPCMVQQIQALGNTIQQETFATPHEVLQKLSTAPMNVALLQATGIGKKIKKVIKSMKQENQDDPKGCLDKLTQLLNKWKEMASNPKAAATSHEQDWKLAEECHSWRTLFKGLKERDETQREALGQKMRANRANLNAQRPTVVKVRPAKAHHERILNYQASGGSSHMTGNLTNPKLQKLRQESAMIAQRVSTATNKSRGSFSRAIAVAACAKRKAETGGSHNLVKRMRTAPLPPAQRRQAAPFSRGPPGRSGGGGPSSHNKNKARSPPSAKKPPFRR